MNTGGGAVELAVDRIGPLPVIRLTGEIDLSNVGGIERRVVSGLDGASAAVLDLTGLTYLDSAGLALLSRLADRFGPALRLAVPETAVVRRAIAVSGLDEAIPVDGTVEDAAAALRRAGGDG